MQSREIIVDVPNNRVDEITGWFREHGWDEDTLVAQSGWLPFERHYRMRFHGRYADQAVLFKLALGGP